MPYWCSACRKYFSVRTGTILQSSNVPLHLWVQAIRWLSSREAGQSDPLHRALGVTEKTALLLAGNIRRATRLPTAKRGSRRRGPGQPRSTTAPLDATADEIAAAIFRNADGGA